MDLDLEDFQEFLGKVKDFGLKIKMLFYFL
jgi:hypothetical protein